MNRIGRAVACVIGGSVCVFVAAQPGLAQAPPGGFCDIAVPNRPGNAQSPPPTTCPPPTEPCHGNCTSSPCYTASGVYTTAAEDLSVITAGPPLVVTRLYESDRVIDGVMGIGWTSSIASPRLAFTTYLFAAPSTYRREADVTLPNGKYYPFLESADGSFAPPAGRHDLLIRNGDGSWDLLIQHSLTIFHFAATGALLTITDDYGNAQSWSYDTSGRVQRVTDAGSGRYLNVFYGADGRVSSIQDQANHQVQYSYNAAGNLAAVTNMVNLVTSYSYTQGRFVPLLTRVQDNWGRAVTDVSYDSVDRTRSYTEDGETFTYTYDFQGVMGQTAKDYGLNTTGNPWRFGTDGKGLISSETPPSGSAGGAKTTVFDASGNPQLVRDEVGVSTFYTYDGEGQVTSITRDYQGSAAVRFDYVYDQNFPGRATSITPRIPSTNQIDSTWQAWEYDYYQSNDPAPGALHHVYRVESDGTTRDLMATYSYDTGGRVVSQVSATGGQTDYVYDAQGNMTTVISPSNNDAGVRPTTRYGYGDVGGLTSVMDPLNHVTSYTYDPLGRTLTVTLPKPSSGSTLKFTTTYSYDNFDAVTGLTFTNVTDSNGIVMKQGYDQFGRLVKSIDGLGNATTYAYSHGLLSSVTDANNNVTSYAYDPLRRLSATNFPEGNAESYSYYADGQLRTRTDRKNQTITYVYDDFKRLLTKRYPNSTNIAFTYTGQLLTQVYDTSTNPAETHSFQYDQEYRVATNVQGPRGVLTYQYNPDDTVLTFSVQGGPTTSYTYYPSGAIDTIAWTPVSGSFKFELTLSGQYQAITMPNGQSRTYSYDDQGRLLRVANLHPTAGNLATYGYGYDLNNATGQYTRLGQRTSMTANVPSQGFAGAVTAYNYDQNYQLIQAAYPNVTPFNGEVDSWQYDAIGNRIGANGQANTYFKNGNNVNNGQRISNDGTNVYAYDANGSTITKSGSLSYNFIWNIENRVISIGGATSAGYAYDYQGRRSSKTDGIVTPYLYNGLNLVREMGHVDYVFGPGIDEPFATTKDGNVSYFSSDSLGTIVATSDTNGVVQHVATFDAWGSTRAEIGTRFHPFSYTGREAGDAGDLFYRARSYSPTIGRFTQEDPMVLPLLHHAANKDPLGAIVAMATRSAPSGLKRDTRAHYEFRTKLYSYVVNNPVHNIDPLGLRPQRPGCDWFPDCFETLPIRRCCDIHDQCYFDFACNWTSWLTSWGNDPCNLCNLFVVQCIMPLLPGAMSPLNPMFPAPFAPLVSF